MAPETGVRLKSVPPETRKRNQRDREIRERYQKGAELINRARSAWGTSRYYQRVELKKQLAPFVPRGTVGSSSRSSWPRLFPEVQLGTASKGFWVLSAALVTRGPSKTVVLQLHLQRKGLREPGIVQCPTTLQG